MILHNSLFYFLKDGTPPLKLMLALATFEVKMVKVAVEFKSIS